MGDPSRGSEHLVLADRRTSRSKKAELVASASAEATAYPGAEFGPSWATRTQDSLAARFRFRRVVAGRFWSRSLSHPFARKMAPRARSPSSSSLCRERGRRLHTQTVGTSRGPLATRSQCCIDGSRRAHVPWLSIEAGSYWHAVFRARGVASAGLAGTDVVTWQKFGPSVLLPSSAGRLRPQSELWLCRIVWRTNPQDDDAMRHSPGCGIHPMHSVRRSSPILRCEFRRRIASPGLRTRRPWRAV